MCGLIGQDSRALDLGSRADKPVRSRKTGGKHAFRPNAPRFALHSRLLLRHCRQVRKTFKYRLYPTVKQAALLDQQLAEACRLFNAALEERRDAWKMRKTSITYYQQAKQLRDIRAHGDLSLANFTSCQDVLRRVDRTFHAFFRRMKTGQKPGYPRFTEP